MVFCAFPGMSSRELNRSLYTALYRSCAGLVVAAVLGLSGNVYGQTQADTIRQKLDLARNYLDSKRAAQIRDNGSSESKKLLQQAQDLYDQARRALKTKNLDQASALSGKVLKTYVGATRANANRSESKTNYARENADLMTEIDAYLQGFLAALKEKGPAMAGLLDQQLVSDLVTRSEKLQASGNQRDAGKLLREAQQLVVTALTKIRSNETVVYSLEFQTPADEYRYERERYDEYLQLAQQVMASGKVAKSRATMFERVLQKGQQLNGEAQTMAASGNYDTAIQRMEKALAKLVQGLQLLGIPVSFVGK